MTTSSARTELNNVTSAGKGANPSAPYADALPSVLEVARSLVPADGFAVWRRDMATHTWNVVASYGISKEFAAISSTGETGMPETPVIHEDVLEDPALAYRHPAYKREGVRGMLAVPITLRDGRNGSIVFYFHRPHKFSKEEVSRASALAELTSTALTSAQLYRDQTKAKERSDFLADASSVLASSLNVDDTLRSVAEMAVPRIADWCTIDLLTESGGLRRIAVTHFDPNRVKVAHELNRRYPNELSPNHPPGSVIASGVPEIHNNISEEMLVKSARDEEHLGILRALGLRAAMVVPLSVRGKVIGVINLVAAESGRSFDDGDLTLATTLANRAAVAVENAQLFHAMRESEEKFRAVSETAACAIYIHDGKHLVYVNRASEELSGYTREELQARDMWDFIHPDDVETVRARASVRFQGGRVPSRYEYRIIRKDGTIAWLDFTAAMIEFGGSTALLATAFDITEQKTAQEALRRNEANLRAITNTIPSLVSYVDTDERYVRVNQAFERWFGKPAQSYIGKKVEEVLGPLNYSHVREKLKAALAGESSQFEASNEYADHPRHVIVTYTPDIDDAGVVRGVVSLVMDVTDRKLAEDALRRSEKLSTAGRLAATIAHEINNPLEAITNLLFLIRNEPAGSEQLNTFIEMADHELRRVSHITRQTLGFYRESVGPTRFELRALVDDVLTLLGRRTSVKQLELRREMDKPAPIIASQGEVRQIVANLLTNAIDATEKGRVIIRLSEGVGRNGLKKITLTVADTGQGIAAQNRSRLFEPFFTTKKDVGTGLGLWVTRQLVEKNGGTIRLRSKQGAGTVFRVTLPEIPLSIG